MARPKRKYKCGACSGTGYEGCSGCGGAGHRLTKTKRYGQPDEFHEEKCSKCRGTGRGAKCPMCDNGWRTS